MRKIAGNDKRTSRTGKKGPKAGPAKAAATIMTLLIPRIYGIMISIVFRCWCPSTGFPRIICPSINNTSSTCLHPPLFLTFIFWATKFLFCFILFSEILFLQFFYSFLPLLLVNFDLFLINLLTFEFLHFCVFQLI